MIENRRDFTINAMAVCLNKERFGELVDPFDGVYDMEDGIIATPLDRILLSDDAPYDALCPFCYSAQFSDRA